MIISLLEILKTKNLKIEIINSSADNFLIAFDVWAKPGSKIEKVVVSNEGVLIIQTRSRPVDGEANQAIVDAVSDSFGIPNSQIEIFRGNKSRLKRIKIKICFTANKKEAYFKEKFSAILSPEAFG